MMLPENLRRWYGLWVADTRTYPDVDYEKFCKRQSLLFAQLPDHFPDDEAVRKAIAGWT